MNSSHELKGRGSAFTLRRTLNWAALLVGISILATWFALKPSIPVSSGVVMPVSKVILAYKWSKLSGSYWENEFAAQSRSLADHPVSERVEFYAAVLIDCDFDTSRALVFDEEIKKDAAPLHAYLIQLTKTPVYSGLPSRKQAVINSWIPAVEYIAKRPT